MIAVFEPAVVTRVPTKDIRMRFRLREPKDDRVKEISESIARIGLLINPLTISKDGYLIAGYHRLAAIKFLGSGRVDVIIKDTTKTDSELIEIDENLKRINLNWIEKAEHIVRREELLEDLGLRMKRVGNQYSTGLITTSALADQIGVSNRVSTVETTEAWRSKRRYVMNCVQPRLLIISRTWCCYLNKSETSN